VVGVLALAGTASAKSAESAGAARATADDVSIRLDFFHSETHSAFFAARDRGFWAKQNLNVTVLPGQGSTSTVQQVAAGNNTFGWANAVAMTQQVARGADVTAIASMRQVFDGGIAFWPDSGIDARNPKSLEGKTCAMTASGFIALLFPVYAQRTGIDRSKINERVLDPAVGNSLFGAHQVDCYESTIVQAKYFFAPRNGVSPGILKYSDVEGMAPLGFVIIQNSRQLRGNPGLTIRFLRGLIQGWNWACANPRQAVIDARKNFPPPAYDLEAGINIWRETCQLARTKAAANLPLGAMALKDWQNTVALLRSAPQLGVTQNVPPASTLFTNQYVLKAWEALKPAAKPKPKPKPKPKR
jgi:NitT/TauT family transport system substrate-binding protein